MRRHTLRRLGLPLVGVLLASLAGAVATGAAPAGAALSGPSGTASPIWQPNAVVYSVAMSSGGTWIAGKFTRLRPPGAATGTDEVPRNHLAVLSTATGEPEPVTYASNGRITVAETSSDLSRVYVGGTFTTFDGAPAGGLVAIDAASRARIPGFAPRVDGAVRAVAATAGVVYLGGDFTAVNGEPRANLAAVDAATGALLPWNPGTDSTVHSLAVGQYSVFVGGAFTRVAGESNYALAAVDPNTGASQYFSAARQTLTQPSCRQKTKDIEVADGVVYVGVEAFTGGCFEGVLAARTDNGAQIWSNTCTGATQTVQPYAGMIVRGSHTHSCPGTADPDDFIDSIQLGLPRQFLSGLSIDQGYIRSWMPDLRVEQWKQTLGPFGMDTDGTTLVVGGDFTIVDGVRQTFLARYTTGDSPTPAPSAPSVTRSGPDEVTVFVRPPVDRDDTDLVIDLYRGAATTPFASLPTRSLVWQQVPVSVKVPLAAGETARFRAKARSAAGGPSSAFSKYSPGSTSVSALGSYATAVKASGPSLYWRLGDPASAAVAGDASGAGGAGIITGKPARGVAGAVADDPAYTFGGTAGQVVSSAKAAPAPTSFTAEAWFNTRTGGLIMGYGDLPRGTSSTRDRQLYVASDGTLRYSTVVGTSSRVEVYSRNAYNDGNWHHAAVTQTPTAITVYIDGNRVSSSWSGNATGRVFDGSWRVGGDSLSSVGYRPSTDYFVGQLDEVAVYPRALSETEIRAHVSAR